MIYLTNEEINSVLAAIETYKEIRVVNGVVEKNLNDAAKKLKAALK